VHPAATDADGVGWLVTREPAGAWWLLAWRHDDVPALDDASGRSSVTLRVALPPALAPRARVEAVALGDDAEGEPWLVEPWSTTPLRARPLHPADGRLVVDLAPESIQLIRMIGPDAVRSEP
jgi:hypothetical protein